MSNHYFQFKQFTVHQDRCAMKVTTDACLFGAWASEEVRKFTSSLVHLLDIGTGTGLLSLMVAQKNSTLIDAIEIDAVAARQALENVSASPWKESINIIHADVLQWPTQTQYDVIIANPPFYDRELKSPKENKNLAHHDGGLKLTDLFSFIKNHLKEKGCFFLLLPAKREKEIETLLENYELFLQQKVRVQQTLNHQPFRLMIQGRCKQIEGVTEKLIVVKNGSDDYTEEFISLLKDYYLHL